MEKRLLASVFFLIFAGCSAGNVDGFRVADTQFTISKIDQSQYKVSRPIGTEDAGFIFTLDHDVYSSVVSVQSARQLCRSSAAKGPNYRTGACSDRDIDYSKIVRVNGTGTNFWEYRDANGSQIATCYATLRTGTCNFDRRYSAVIYSMSIPDDRIGEMRMASKTVEDLLLKWERGPASQAL
ncbi:hypothetical protein VCJ71_02585 [Alteriqipengyuania sp. WL0013]|uniref:hypothetical protein n=1 Tax=Alteriqipengyuania sp. WL0013 TaxID=3110773 RepID=UPI002D090D17|nr:hypothetical protein [Alteriqipengyuania sp. WL0013]MEB3414947.1 hypothetical protein [Alteriqipengyuania sp. WL0013]